MINKKKIIAVFVSVMFVIALFSVTAYALKDDEDLQLLGTSSEYTLGDSQSVSVHVLEDGSLEDNNLVLVLQMSGSDVSQVKMRDTQRILDEKETRTLQDIQQSDQSDTVGEESTDSLDETLFSPDYSEASIKSPALRLGESSLSNDDTQVEFEVSQAGTYFFDLYDTQGNLITTKEYIVNFADEILQLNFENGVTYDIQTMSYVMVLNYYTQGITDGEEVVTIKLPPGYSFADVPLSNSSYTVETSVSNVTAEDYEGIENAGPLITYMEELQTQGKAPLTAQTMTIHFKPGIENLFQLTFTTSISYADFIPLSNIMVAYGTEPDKVPILFSSEAKVIKDDTQTTIAKSNLVADSTIHNDAKPSVMSDVGELIKWESVDTTILTPTISAERNKTNYSVAPWHYPVTDAYYYLPKPADGSALEYIGTFVEDEVSIPGETVTYYKIPMESAPDIVNYRLQSGTKSTLSVDTYFQYQFSATQDELAKDGVHSIGGPVYISYTYMGEECGPYNRYETNPVTVNVSDIQLGSQYFATGAGTASHTTGDERKQNYDGDKIGWTLSTIPRSSSNNVVNIAPTFEDLQVAFEFSYEISPTSIEINTKSKEANHYTLPQSVTYYLYDDPTPYTVSNFEEISKGPNACNQTIDLPVTKDQHIQKIILNYDLYSSLTETQINFTINNAAKDQLGNPLPEVQPVEVKVDIGTVSGKYTNQYATDSPVYYDYSFETRVLKYKLVGLSDSLHFGTVGTSYFNDLDRGKNSLTLKSLDIENTTNAWDNWQMSFVKGTPQMKDYEDVVVSVKPTTQEEKQALSLVNGVYASSYGYSVGTVVDKFEVVFKTNLSGDTWQLAPEDPYYTNFPLSEGEYVTEIEIRLGTLYGSNMTADSSSDVGKSHDEVVYRNNSSYDIAFLFNDHRSYFKGTPEEIAIANGDVLHLSAVASTSSVAQHINGDGGDNGFVNDSSTGTIYIYTEFDATVSGTGTMMTYQTSPNNGFWLNNPQSFYQGSSFVMNMYNLKSAFSIPTGLVLPTFPSSPYDLTYHYYFEVNNDFALLEIEGGTFVSATPVPGKDTTLYVYEFKTFGSEMEKMFLKFYVRPDAQVTGVAGTPVLLNMGFSLSPFLETLTPISGENAYYTQYPYLKLKTQSIWFPSEWGISQTDTPHQFLYSADYTVKPYTQAVVNSATLDKITLVPSVEGTFTTPGAFAEHQKQDLSVTGFMANATNSDIKLYEAVYQIPRKDTPTIAAPLETGDPNLELPNEFNMYLTGPAVFHNSTTTPVSDVEIHYYDKDGTEVDLGDSPTEETLRKVVTIKLTFQNFHPQDVRSLEIPLEADITRGGADIQEYSSYVGASSRYSVIDEVLPNASAYSDAAEFVAQPYNFSFRVGQDADLNGTYASALPNGLAKTTIYYEDDDGVEKEFYTTTDGGLINLSVPNAVTRIITQPVDSLAGNLKLTTQNSKLSGANAGNDSDFPQDTGILEIKKADLIIGGTNIYNNYTAIYYAIPTIEASDVTVVKTETENLPYTIESSVPSLTYSNKGTQNLQIVYSDPTDTTIATIGTKTFVPNNTASTTGVNFGETPYTVAVKTPFGDSIPDTGTIKVIPSYVSGATIQKELELGSQLLNPTDTFSVQTWYEGGEDNKTTTTNITTTQGVTISNTTIAKNGKNYIQETNKSGYKNTGFEVTINGSIVPLTQESDGSYSYDVPSEVNSMSIKVINKITKVPSGTLTKTLTNSSMLVSTSDRFSFQTWSTSDIAADGSISKTDISNVQVDVDESLNFVFTKGETNYITEQSSEGYRLNQIEIQYSLDGVTYISLPVTNTNGVYSFDVPDQAGYLQITATNENATSALTVTKQFDESVTNLYPDQEYQITVKAKSGTTNTFQDNLKVADTKNVGDLVQRVTYVVSEGNLPGGVKLQSVQILNGDGELVGTQPTKQADGSYEFSLTAAQDGAVLVVTNGMEMGSGLVLNKQIVNSSLAKEEFTFTLEGDNGYKAYGRVEKDAVYHTNQSPVLWYLDAAYTKTVDVSSLPVGNYTVKETSSNTNYELDQFSVISGTAVGAGTLTFSVTTTSDPVYATADNQVKEAASVVVNKTMDITDFRQTDMIFKLTHKDTNQVYTGTGSVLADASNYGANGLVIDEWYLVGDSTNYQGKLPYGEYELTEDVSTQVYYDFAGFEAQTGVTLSADKKTATFTLTGEPGEDSLSVGAHNDLKTGSLTITKEILGGYGNETSHMFEFEVYRWDGSSGTLVDLDGTGAGTVREITMNSPQTTTAITIDNLPYGKYYVVEKDSRDYTLMSSSSQVIAENGVPATTNILTLDSPVGTNFGAKNKLKGSQNSFEGFKQAEGASVLGAANANTFEFELRRASDNLLFYTGVASSNLTGIESGAAIQWTATTQATALGSSTDGTSIVGLPYGNYVVKETNSGNDFKSKAASTSTGFGTVVNSSEISFTIGSESEAMTENTVTFVNQLKEEGEVKVNKVFENNANPFPGTVFEFLLKNETTGEIYTGTTDGSSHVASWMSVSDSTKVYPYNELPYGTYSILEVGDANYNFVDFKDAQDQSSLGTNPTFTLLSSNKTIELNAVNAVKNNATLEIVKSFENNYNHDSSASFQFLVYGPKENGVMPTTTTTILTVDETSNWRGTLSNLRYGEYLIVEGNPGSEYEPVALSHSGGSVVGTDANGNSNGISIVLGAKAGQNMNGNISAINRVARNGEIVIGKQVEGLNPLPDTIFYYTLTNAIGESQTIAIHAGEELKLEGQLLGNYTIVESMNSDFNFLGFEVDAGTRTVADQVGFRLDGTQLSSRVISFSSVKQDGSYTIRPELDPEIAQIAANESYDFKVYQSVDDGETWDVVKIGMFQDSVTLKAGESYTYDGLLRGALYKAVSERTPTSAYMVKEIRAEEGTVFSDVNLSEGSATFQPMGATPDGKATFIMDYKRMDLVIDKFYNDTGAKIEGVQFILQRKGTHGWDIVKFNQTDAQGQIVLKDLLAGEYRLTERMGPRNVVVLQSEINFSIENNRETGLLEVKISENEVVRLENNILHIANGFKDRSGGGSGQPDGNPGGAGISGEGAAGAVGSQNMGTTNEGATVSGGILAKLPDTGGIPLWYLAIIGAGLTLLGIVVLVVEKKRKH